MAVLHRARLTAAAEIALPKAGLSLTRVRVWAGATPGALVVKNTATTHAVFPCPSNGTRGYASYNVNERYETVTIASSVFTWVGGLSVAELTFSDGAGSGTPLSSWRAAYVLRADGGAVTADITLTFTGVTDAVPRGCVTYISASTGRVIFPQNAGLTFANEGVVSDSADALAPMPNFGSGVTSLTPSAVTDGAATILHVVYY